MKQSNNHHEGFSPSKEGKMMSLIVRLATAVAVMTLLICASQPTPAADYPDKRKYITQIVPAAVGSSSDIGARYMQPLLEKELGVSMPILNKPGGAGAIGVLAFLSAPPDGYTIYWANSGAFSATYLDLKRQPTHSRKDFVLVANIAFEPACILVRPDSPYKNLKDLIDAAKANPGKIKGATSNIMSTSHISAVQLEQVTGVKFTYVIFDSTGAQRAALLGGHVDVEFNTTSEVARAVNAGQLRALAVFDDQPSRFLPGVPTALFPGL